jgi:hypothetical protein
MSVESGRTLVLRIESLSDQVYSMEDDDGTQYHWNATKAERLGKAGNRLFAFSLSEAGITPEKILSQYPDLDEVHALNSDLSKPLVFVPFAVKDQLVDGWHRLYKASLLGVDEMLAYFLTDEQAEQCLIVKLPPGQGVDWGQPPRKAEEPAQNT